MNVPGERKCTGFSRKTQWVRAFAVIVCYHYHRTQTQFVDFSPDVPYERLFDYFFSRSADPDHRAEVRPEPVKRLTTSGRRSSTAAARPREERRVEYNRQ